MDALWAHENKSKDVDTASYVTAAGLLTNMPGSQSQHWHRDGPDEGYIDCFVPLIDLNEEIGPTAIQPNTHTTTSDVASVANSNGYNVLVPMLKKGDILMFDYRTIHRGLGNKSLATTRTLAYAVFGRKKGGSTVELGDVHNFPAALTLEYD
jgi:ectoine hydroxylase-related dioxygenase (phytanoyl-CoA dioxygenase family)